MISMGYTVPTAINQMIKKDVEKDVQAGENVKNNQSAIVQLNFIEPTRIDDFIKKVTS